MTAKEMFEELGYELIGSVIGTYYFDYWKKKDKIKLNGVTYYFNSRITFDEDIKAIHKMVIPIDNEKEWYGTDFLTVEELKAINKQIEELGWND